METILIIALCLLVAIAGELYVARHKHRDDGTLPEDIQ